jgi:hypothetical protein
MQKYGTLFEKSIAAMILEAAEGGKGDWRQYSGSREVWMTKKVYSPNNLEYQGNETEHKNQIIIGNCKLILNY